MADNTFNTYVKELGGLAPDFRTNMSDFPQLAAICKNFWVRGNVLRQAGKTLSYEAQSDIEYAPSAAAEYDKLLLVLAGDIYPFGGIRGSYRDKPFRYVQNDIAQILSPYVYTGHCDFNDATNEVTFNLLEDDAATKRCNPMRFSGAGCKIRLLTGASQPWVRINTLAWAGSGPGTVTATINATDLTGAAHGYATCNNVFYEITWMFPYTWTDSKTLTSKFVRMYGKYLMMVNNFYPISVWDGGDQKMPQRYADFVAGASPDGAQGWRPHFRWLSVLDANHGNEYQAIDSYASGLGGSVNYGNHWFGYGCYHADGVNILRGANAACNFMEYLVLGGTLEVAQPIITTDPAAPADPEPYCIVNGTAVTFGTAATWDIDDYTIKEGDIFVAPPEWNDGIGNNPALAERWAWPDYSGGWGKIGDFHTIVDVDTTGAGSLTLNSSHSGTVADHMPFAILRKKGGSYVRWCNAAANGGFTNWNPSGDYDGSYREMGWGNGDIQDIKQFGGAAWTFKRDGIGRLSYTGNYDVFRLDYVSGQIGTHGGFNSVVETPRGLFFPHGDDYYMFDGTQQSLNEPVATGHRRVFGGFGNSADLIKSSGGYDAYHRRAIVANIKKDTSAGAYLPHILCYNLDTGQWAQLTASQALENHNIAELPTMVHCGTRGLYADTSYGISPRQDYIMVGTEGGPFGGGEFAISLVDYDPVAHLRGNTLFWCKIPPDTVRWKSSPFDMGFIDYKKDVHFMRMIEDSLSDTVLPTYWHRLWRSNDFAGDWADTYGSNQEQTHELRVSGNRFQYEIYGDGGQEVGYVTPSSYTYLTIAADTKIAYKVTVGSKAVPIKGVAFYGKYNASNTAQLKFGVYSDDSGVPDALQGSTLELTATQTLSATRRWHYSEYSSGGLTLAANTDYWFCLQAGTAAVDVAYETGGAVNSRATAIPDVYVGGLSAGYGLVTGYDTKQLCLFVQSAGNTRGSGIGGIAIEWTKQDRNLTIR